MGMAHLRRHLEPLLKRCTTLPRIKQFHAHLLTSDLYQSLPSLRSKLIEFCATLPSAPSIPHASAMLAAVLRPVTNDLNAVLRGLALSPHPHLALPFYASILPRSLRPDALTLSFALQACARLSAFLPSSQLHAHALRLGVLADVILATTLLDAYAKSGRLDLAEQVFDEMPLRDIASWNALILGFAGGNRARDALLAFDRLCTSSSLTEREQVNEITVIGALSACAQLGALREGEEVESRARQHGFWPNVRVQNALIDMYAKCGSVERAEAVFRSMNERSLVSWNAIIMGFGLHGRGERALCLFDEMLTLGTVEPDAVTYLAVLCGCNHAGLVDEGLRVFRSMKVAPNVKHYGTIVDLLGRAGRLSDAYSVISSMPSDVEPDVVLWQTLLGACKTYGHVELAEYVSNKLHEMGSNGCGDYVLLSNVYAAKERWSDVDRVRDEMIKNDVRKVPGFSYTEIDGVVHKFLNGDQGHERWKEIYRKLDEIGARIKGLGYVPDVSNVLHDVGEEDKENVLYHHSEKLAIAFGLIGTTEGTPIHVMKNLRICGDCHMVAKLISKAYDRVIIIRDRARYHHFEGGECSCKDYW